MSVLVERAGLPARRAALWPEGFVAALLLVGAASVVFYYRQNFAGQVGGPISIEKSLWLNYAITAWFVIPAFLVAHPALSRPLRSVLGWFLANMLARGVVELWLIYVTFGWSPLYGIAHDVFSIVLIAVLRRRARLALAALDPFNAAVRRFCTSIQASLGAETVFAALFFGMGVHGDAVYFAPPTAAFAHINLLTRGVDVVVYADLALLFWRQRGPLFGRRATGAARP